MMLKRITLIRPNMGNYRSSDALAPLALAILAARTPPEITVTFYDDRIEVIPHDDTPDLVALSVETFSAQRAYEIAAAYRSRGVTVVMGGYHPTLMSEEVLEHADAIVVGDAEGCWERLLDDFKHDRLQQRYSGGNEETLDDYRIDRSIFKGKKYVPVELIQYGRGCRFTCEFCSIDAFYKNKVRLRPVESVINEIKQLNKKRLLFFVDDNLFSSKKELYALLDALTPLRMRWSCQISIDVAKDDALLDRLRASGCIFVLIGFESLSPENLKQMGKSWNSLSGEYLEIVKKFHSRGIAVYGTFVFGYDYDTPELIEQSFNFALEAKLEIANFNPLTPTPGSALYARLEKEGRLLKPQWWRDSSYRYGDPILIPKQMSPELFAVKCFEAKKGFYAWNSIIRRLLFSAMPWNFFRFGMVVLANVVSRHEVLRKQHKRLGE
jgi:radical SAM superfamily enzyme YgiQ (UPF0313 family)